jgi:hypothetical protein
MHDRAAEDVMSDIWTVEKRLTNRNDVRDDVKT